MQACQTRVKNQEFSIKKLQDKIAALPVTKKNKPEISKLKDNLLDLQYDGNYRAALEFVRKQEEAERERKRDAADKADEEALAAGGLKGKKDDKNGAAKEPLKKIQPAAAKPVTVEM